MSSLTEALIRVDSAADYTWKEAAAEAVRAVAERYVDFTTDDVWDFLESNYPGVTTHEPRALGPVMIRAVKEGLCEIKTCDHCGTNKVVVTSSLRERHATDQAVYKSLVRRTA